MKLSDYDNKYGQVAALIAINKENLSARLKKALTYEYQIKQKYGNIPVEQLPSKVQSKIIATNKIVLRAKDVIYKYRAVEVKDVV